MTERTMQFTGRDRSTIEPCECGPAHLPESIHAAPGAAARAQDDEQPVHRIRP